LSSYIPAPPAGAVDLSEQSVSVSPQVKKDKPQHSAEIDDGSQPPQRKKPRESTKEEKVDPTDPEGMGPRPQGERLRVFSSNTVLRAYEMKLSKKED